MAITLCAAMCLAAATASAQGLPGLSSVEPSRQTLNPAEELPSPKAAGRAEDRDGVEEPGPCPLAASPLRFTLKSVDFDGADHINLRDLAPSFRDDLGETISLGEVCKIRDRAGQILFRRGVLARVEIPEQEIAEGRLRLAVVQAHVVSVQVRGDAGPAQELIEAYLQKLRGMRPFDIRKAQRYLLLASDVPGVQISASLRPAAGGQGAVDLIVVVSRKAVDVAANIQDFAPRTLGPYGATLRGDFNSLTRFGDKTSLILYSTVGDNAQEVAQIVSEARIGDEGLVARGSVSYGYSRPGGDLKDLNLDSASLVVDASLIYPLLRSRSANVNLGAGFNLIDQKTEFRADDLLVSDDLLRIFYLHGDFDRRWKVLPNLLPPGTFAGQLDVRRGVDGLGSSTPGQTGLSRMGGRPDALVVRGDARLDLLLTPLLSTHVAVLGQYSPQALLSYEQFIVGNLTVGRGYDPSSLTGDEGLGGQFEVHVGPFRTPRSWVLPSTTASVIGFYDVVSVHSHGAGAIDRTVRSTGAGLSFQVSSRVRLDLLYAKPLVPISNLIAKPPPQRFLFNLTTSFL